MLCMFFLANSVPCGRIWAFDIPNSHIFRIHENRLREIKNRKQFIIYDAYYDCMSLAAMNRSVLEYHWLILKAHPVERGALLRQGSGVSFDKQCQRKSESGVGKTCDTIRENKYKLMNVRIAREREGTYKYIYILYSSTLRGSVIHTFYASPVSIMGTHGYGACIHRKYTKRAYFVSWTSINNS